MAVLRDLLLQTRQRRFRPHRRTPNPTPLACNLPSRVAARWEKMSRIKAVRSHSRTPLPSALSRLRSCPAGRGVPEGDEIEPGYCRRAELSQDEQPAEGRGPWLPRVESLLSRPLTWRQLIVKDDGLRARPLHGRLDLRNLR